MMVEELGLLEEGGNPYLAAFVTFVSFNLFGFIPCI
jgi:hypothetical protein